MKKLKLNFLKKCFYSTNIKTIINIFKEDIKFSSAHFTIFEDETREDLHVNNFHKTKGS
jgi:hypothetical protein